MKFFRMRGLLPTPNHSGTGIIKQALEKCKGLAIENVSAFMEDNII